MARVTVEDCTNKIQNRFELVVYAAQRTRQLAAGSPLGVERDNDKNPVVSLREIAADHVGSQELREAVIAGFRCHVEVEPQEEEYADLFLQDTSSYFIDQTKQADHMMVDDSNTFSTETIHSDSDHSDEHNQEKDLEDSFSNDKDNDITGDDDFEDVQHNNDES